MSTIVKDKKSKKLHADFYTPDGVHKRISARTGDPTAAKVISGQAELFARRNHGKVITRLTIMEGAEILTKSVNDQCCEKYPVAGYLPQLAAEASTSKSSEVAKDLVTRRLVRYFKAVGLGDIDMWDVTTGHIRSFLSSIKQEFGLSDLSIRTYGQTLYALWEAALDAHVVKTNVVKKIKHPKRPATSPRRPFEKEELEILFVQSDEEWRGMIVVGASTGLRIGDVSLMIRADVDLATGSILVKARKPGELEKKPIPPAYLDRFRQYCTNKQPHDPLFPRAYKWFMERGNSTQVTIEFRHLLERCGLRVKGQKVRGVKRIGANKYLPLTFHCLRHNYITMLQILGACQAVAGALGGPKSAAVLTVYTHISEAHLINAVKDYPDYFKDLDNNNQLQLSLKF